MKVLADGSAAEVGKIESRSGLAGLDWKTISLASIGGGLEFYDFIAYGVFAQYIAKAFFPAEDPAVSLVNTFAVFAVGYLSRPFGGVLFSHVGDTFGRRRAFLISLITMTAATMAMAAVPAYETIGLAATVLFIFLRFIQGCCVGGELPGAITYVVETAPRRAGLACGVMFFCVNTGSFIAVFVSSMLHSYLTADEVQSYGWRIGFAVGGVLGVVGFLLRSKMQESELFKSLGERRTAQIPAMEVIRSYWGPVLLGVGIVGINQAFIAILNVGMTPYLSRVAGYDVKIATSVISYAVGLLSFGIVAVGFVSDLLPRRRIFQLGALLLIVGSYPLYQAILGKTVDLYLLFAVAAVVCALVSGTFGALAAELFPTRLRFSGLAISYNLAAALAGGFTPLITSWIVATGEDKAAPGIYLSIVAAVGLFSALLLGRVSSGEEARIDR
ncbi:MFS transporter [Bradyrhizobium tropiciagri]|uniref:MFS transporter n=1 Tax=Bradyrhizobium tropiciagri TaxID=312253 RepID=UPI001BAA1CEE|nr:MFS transporter [Bradyrhizobium tropiciagri]MBR0896776.1 MFS transporter [Bradyrhizobium tropiciagri]